MPYFLSWSSAEKAEMSRFFSHSGGLISRSLCPLSLSIHCQGRRGRFSLRWSDLASLGRKEVLALPGRLSEEPDTGGLQFSRRLPTCGNSG